MTGLGRGGDDRGSAVVEFVSLGVLLLIPLVYFVIAMGRVQAASFAAENSAREAARAYVTADNDADGRQRAGVAVRLGLRDQGFGHQEDGAFSIRCAAVECLTPGSRVLVLVEVTVILPGVPRFIGRPMSTSVRVRAAQTAVVDRFRLPGAGP